MDDTFPGIDAVRSLYPFDETVRRIEDALEAKQIKLFARIDQHTEAKAVGLDLLPICLLVFGNPAGGTALMRANPLAALDLPLKAVVAQMHDGTVQVAFNRSEYLIARHKLPAGLRDAIAPVEALLRHAVSV